MYEVEVVEGLVRVGWSAPFSKLELGIEQNSFGYGCTGKKSVGKQFEDYGEGFQAGDIIGCLLDRDKQTISFCKNGKSMGVAFELPSDVRMVGLKPHICGKAFKVAVKLSGDLEYPVQEFGMVGEADADHVVQVSTQAKVKHPPMCIILEPTRELAEQTYNCMVKFSKYLQNPAVSTCLFVGGMDEKAQLSALDKGVDICVGTLQKMMDHIRRGKIDVSKVKFLVLDEADDLQKKDDRNDIPQLNTQIKNGRRDRVQTLLFSATLHTPEIKKLVEEVTTRPVWVDLKGKDSVPETVHHAMIEIDPSEGLPWADSDIAVRAKFPNEQPSSDGVHAAPSMSPTDQNHHEMLRWSEQIKQMKPKALVKVADAFKMSQCIVFCRTNLDCDNLEAYLHRLDGTKKAWAGKMESGKENPYSCRVLAGARNVKERQGNLQAFKEGDVRFLICTDVAARGLDISGLPFVIQMTMPDDIENYIHRIGRCGRADRMGLAISLVATAREKVWYHKGPSKGKDQPPNTKLTIPFGPDGQLLPRDMQKCW
jgi:ATP-dependent RNA helicase DDX1